jgi:hypothetical protein
MTNNKYILFVTIRAPYDVILRYRVYALEQVEDILEERGHEIFSLHYESILTLVEV